MSTVFTSPLPAVELPNQAITPYIFHRVAFDHLYIVDRLEELIKYKGFQVPPAELEALLLTHPDVADAAVIGVPDAEAGELPKAFVVLEPGHHPDEQSVMDHVAEHVARYKRIRTLEFVAEIPKSASGKILHRIRITPDRVHRGRLGLRRAPRLRRPRPSRHFRRTRQRLTTPVRRVRVGRPLGPIRLHPTHRP